MKIVDVLREEKSLLVEMLDILKSEKEILIKDNINELDKIIKVKEDLKYRIDDMEKIRISICGEKKLKNIILDLKGQEAWEVESIGKEIGDIVYGIRELNNTNDLLLKQSLYYVRTVINALSPVKPSIYKPTGRMEQRTPSTGILNKSV